MDLGAYVQIEDFDKIVKANGIDIPRLRGYRLMKDESPLSQKEIDKIKDDLSLELTDNMFYEWVSFWSGEDQVERLRKKYLTRHKDEEGDWEYTGIRWDNLHGKKRRELKFELKKLRKAIQKEYDAWNKYAGKEGVLYVHSRTGGNNWWHYLTSEERYEILNAPWFLDRVDDCWDDTYCNYFVKINLDVKM